MKEEKYSSLEELYKRLLPALRTKKEEMLKEKLRGITVEDIWLYFCKNVWTHKNNLSLGEMVNDILNTDSMTIYTNRKGE